MPDFKYTKAIIDHGVRKELVLITSYTLDRKQDGDDIIFPWGSDQHIATGKPDGRRINGWDEVINANILINASERIMGGELVCPSFCGKLLVIDKKKYAIRETSYRGGCLYKNLYMPIQVVATRYEEDRRTISYHA